MSLSKLYKHFKKILGKLCTYIGGVVLFMMLYSFLSFQFFAPNTPSLSRSHILTLSLDGDIPERHGLSSLQDIFKKDKMTLIELSQLLRRGATDDRIQAVALGLKTGDYSIAQVQELRDALYGYKKQGKPIYVYAESFGQLGSGLAQYYLASMADEIWLHPLGDMNTTGIALTQPFIKDFLKKLGLEAHLFHAGDYKSSHEVFTQSYPSPENRRMTERLINTIFDDITLDIAYDRDMNRDELHDLIDQAPLSSETAMMNNMVDSIGYFIQFKEHVQTQHPKSSTVAISTYNRAEPVFTGRQNTIHTVIIDDVIQQDNNPSPASFLPERLAQEVILAAKNDNVKAIILRVNSPGGTPIASEHIRRAVVIARGHNKPVIVSMGSMATSGGYWVSMSGDFIIGYPLTLTGSIGVFGGKLGVTELIDRMDINTVTVQRGKNADIWSPTAPLTNNHKAILQRQIDATYADFTSRVRHARGIDNLDPLAEGRVWTGLEANQNGLIDFTGTYQTAIDIAMQMGDVDKANQKLSFYPRAMTPIQKLTSGLQKNIVNLQWVIDLIQEIKIQSRLTGYSL